MKFSLRMSLLAWTIAGLTSASTLQAQTETLAPAAVVKAADWQAVMATSVADNILDTKVNQTAVKGGIVRVGIIHRTRPETRALMHQEFTETYYIVEGSGTLVTGGTMEEQRPVSDPPNLGPTPSFFATQVGGVTQHVGVGDIVVIPPGVPHRLSELDSPMSYIIYRFEVTAQQE
jgi:mannose-6-phosphate isomerase-like protein (cupin superfamily)